MKTAYFFSLTIKNKNTEQVQDISMFPQLIDRIIEHSSAPGDYRTIDITPDDDTLRTIVDIIEHTDEHLFARFSKQRLTNSVVGRNYRTMQTEPVLGKYKEYEKGIENYSFVYINYSTLIAEIAMSQYSPNETSISNLIKMYTDYYVEIKSLANRNGIEQIFKHVKPTISSISVDIPTPDPVILKHLGLSDNEIQNLFGNDLVAKITFSPTYGRTIVSGDDVETVVAAVKQNKPNLIGAVIRARSHSGKSRDYNLYEDSFKYDINIPSSHTENGKTISYTEEELITSAKEKLISNYNVNRDIIIPLANRG